MIRSFEEDILNDGIIDVDTFEAIALDHNTRGFIIPTGKVIVGLGLVVFRMPVALVFCVNTGILISGLMLLRYAVNLSVVCLCVLIGVIAVFLVLMH